MSQEQHPDATPQHEDGARIVQPFAFTTGGGGDYRPMIQKVQPGEDAAPKARPEPVAPVVPPESATGHADLPNPDPTADEFEKQLQAAAQQQSENAPKSDSTDQQQQAGEPSESSAKSAPSLAGRAKSKESSQTGDSSQTSS